MFEFSASDRMLTTWAPSSKSVHTSPCDTGLAQATAATANSSTRRERTVRISAGVTRFSTMAVVRRQRNGVAGPSPIILAERVKAHDLPVPPVLPASRHRGHNCGTTRPSKTADRPTVVRDAILRQRVSETLPHLRAAGAALRGRRTDHVGYRLGADPEHDTSPHRSPEDCLSMGDHAFELGHGRHGDGDAPTGELGGRRMDERDPDAEHRYVVDAASQFSRFSFDAADSIPPGTEAFDPTAVRHIESSLPARRWRGADGDAGSSAPDADLLLHT